ncbi:MAG: hypothetical protein IOD12_03875, partial [Silvanigrellales bacterium]|nr:hypothetical protein [Silvanigrellales bacterium]
MNFPRYSLNVFRLALLAALTLAAGCLKRNFNIQSEANAKTSNPLFSLDVNDVSFLFPLPKNVSQIDSLFPLTFSTRSGPLVEKALFQDIVQKADYKSDVTGTRLRSGVVFSGRRRELRQNFVGPRGTQSFSPGPFSFDDMAKWRIVGFRFDPCSPRIDADRMQKDLVVLPSSFEGNDFCSTQIRLIAQPLLTVGEDFMSETDVGMPGVAMQPSDADKEKMQAGDYALHLVYEVGQNKAKEIASSLLEIKSACGGLSEGLPLGVHPCLRSASIQKTRKDALMQSIGDILKNHATNLAAVAVMGTELSQEPWVFYVGAISKDKKSF